MNLEVLTQTIELARNKYYKLILVLSLFAESKTRLLKAAAEERGYPYINLSMELAGRMLDMPEPMRSFQVTSMFPSLVRSHKESLLLLDNIEILFLPELKVDPLRALQSVSRNKLILAGWAGEFSDSNLTYAKRGHPEFKLYPAISEEECTVLKV